MKEFWIMKNIHLYGPGFGPNVFVDDTVADEITSNFDKNEALPQNLWVDTSIIMT